MTIKQIFATFTLLTAMASCSDKSDDFNSMVPVEGYYSLSGTVEKGPFVRGSSISVQPLNESLKPIGTVYNGEIADDAGSFDLGEIELASQFVRISADGYYFNEVAGGLSNGTLHLIAYADLTNRSSVNVNILTHLKSSRIQKLMSDGSSFAQANRQAHEELLSQFGLQSYSEIPAESMTITSGTDGAGVLIAISTIVLSERTDAEITQYLSILSQDLADDGRLTDANITSIYQGKNLIVKRLEQISENIANRYSELGVDISLPDLRYFFDWDNDGIAGNEIVDNIEITLSQEQVKFGKDGGQTTVTVTSNIPLFTEQYKDPYDNTIFDTPTTSVTDNLFDNFFIDNGNPMSCEYTYSDNTLTIKVGKTEKWATQHTTIPLYDKLGICRASVEVLLEGDSTIEIELGSGRDIINSVMSAFANAASWHYYMENSYTGISPFHNIVCPISTSDSYNNKTLEVSYTSIRRNNTVINFLENNHYEKLAAKFHLLNVILYTSMVDKWGRIGIAPMEADVAPVEQQSADKTLQYLNNKLDGISELFDDNVDYKKFTVAEDMLNLPKDIWRIAKSDVLMALGRYDEAITHLEEIIDSKRYTLLQGGDHVINEGAILHIYPPYDLMNGGMIGYYNIADVHLKLAECYLMTGNSNAAKVQIDKVAKAKLISDIEGITDTEAIGLIRKRQMLPGYFAFQKRNGLGGYEDYQHLWPIPEVELSIADWTQNPGYSK